jgi:ribosomal protein L10
MSTDPVLLIAKQRIIKLSAELEAQLSDTAGGAPAVEIWHRLQVKAAESLAALAFVDADEPKLIRALQNEVKKYDEWTAELRGLIQEGIAYDQEQRDADREELRDVIAREPDAEERLRALGLIDAPVD